MKIKLTRKEQILQILDDPEKKLTCGEIVKKVIYNERLTGNTALYLSGGMSSILNRMVKDKILKYADTKGPRGGYRYQLGTQKYVAGFFFNEDRTKVALIQKNRPQWMAGLHNGIGGKMKPNEKPKDAMAREFYEETGATVLTWQFMLTLTGPGFIVHFFYEYGSNKFFETIRTTEDEKVVHVDVMDALSGAIPSLDNLPWLVELAMYLINNPTFKITLYE